MIRQIRLVFLTLCLLLGVVLFVGGCGRGDRTRPPSDEEVKPPPLSPVVPDTDSKQILSALSKSVHKKLDCSDCHAPARDGAASADVGKGTCTKCHSKETKAYAETIHAERRAAGQEEAATCESCHGAHDTKAMNDPASQVSPRNLATTCGKCHQNPELARKLGIKQPLAVQQYLESIHGRRLMNVGLMVAPSCADCHGKAHRIFKASDPRSTVHRNNVTDTCGACHAAPRDNYLKGFHAKAFNEQKTKPPSKEKGEHPAPTCQTCHTAHQIVERGPVFQLAADRICGECHQDRLERYLETYHGRAHDLGDEDVAACHDCHGEHDIRPVSDPASTLSDQNRMKTCQKCHVGVSENFTGFLAHADHRDRENYPMLYWAFIAMTGLLVGTFGFFGIHTVLWLTRSLIERSRNPEAFRAQKAKNRKEEGTRFFVRFRAVDRFAHMLVIVSFLLLVITGMPLKFHSAPWAKQVFDVLGGPSTAASLHRFGAFITLTYFIIHLASLIGPIRNNRKNFQDESGKFKVRRFLGWAFGPDSPLPRLQDLKDVRAHMKWFFGKGPKPKFDRFTYWEKFDYLAVFWGVTVIGLSGLVMWFPEAFTRVLPGWSINIAHIIHSDEALLAAGFIFTFHFFNSHFRPEKFPMDSVMFSGKLSEEELQHEHAAQYERLKAERRLEDDLSPGLGEWKQWKWVLNPFGAFAILLGVILAIAIFWSLLS